MIKKFNLSITLDVDNNITINTENAGFNAAEIIGFLEMKKQDVIDQIRDDTNVKYKRTVINDGKTIEIEDVEK